MAPAVRQMSTEEGQRPSGARMFFEVGLAREAARTATPSDPSLSDALEANRRRSATGIVSPAPTSPSISNWPASPAISCSSRCTTRSRAEGTAHVTLAADGQEQTAYEAHRAIYDGIVARDPDRAEQAMRSHSTS
jgi:GntR family transcriptional repressor for pyruvate dehydrogenase complex